MERWPLNKSYFWEQAPFFRILLPFAAGIFCYDRGLPVAGGLALAIAGVTFLLYLWTAYNKRLLPYPWVAFALINTCLFFGGLSISYYNDVRHDATWFGNKIEGSTSYLVRVDDAPAEKENSWKMPVKIISAIGGGKVTKGTGKAFLYAVKGYEPMTLHKGDSILVPNKWELIHNAGNPFEFDYATYCRRNDIWYTQFVHMNDIRLYGQSDPDKLSVINKAHDYCMQQLATYLPDTVTKGLMQAMLLGDEVNLDEDLRQSYSQTGIVHIIAISGGNVMIFFTIISVLLWWLRHKKHAWIKYAIAFPLVWFYIIMAGANPSAIRAAIMFSIIAFAIIFQKDNNSLNTLFATAFLLLFGEPMWLFSLGFQLSFAAVLSIILFYTPVYKWWSPPNKASKALWKVTCASIAAEILVAPLVVYYFHTFPLLFIIANVLAYLFMGLTLWLGMGIIVFSFVPSLARFIGTCTIWLVIFFDRIVVLLQKYNPASFHTLVLTGFELALIYLLIICTAYFVSKKNKRALFAGLGIGCLLLCSLCYNKWVSLHRQQLVVYNISKVNRVELITGNTYHILSSDTGNVKRIDYAVTPTHINMRANSKDCSNIHQLIKVGGKTVLLLSKDISNYTPVHADYVVMAYRGIILPSEIKQLFSPGLVIISNNYTAKEQAAFAKECAAAGINCYTIAGHGAFVLN